MTDGRLEVYGAEKFVALQGGIPGRFRALDEKYRFGVVLVHHSLVASDDLLRWLYFNSNWKLVHVDEVAVLFVRASDEESWPEMDIDAPDLFGSLDGVSDGEFTVRMKSRANFYNAFRRPKLALQAWKEGVAAERGMRDDPVVHATLLYKAGFAAAAEAILQQQLEERPDDPMLHTQVGMLRFESGDLDAARDRFERALALDPRHAGALYQRALLAEREEDLEMATDLYFRVLAVTTPMERASVLARQRLIAAGQVSLSRE